MIPREGSPVPRARQITLSASERRKLKALAYSHTAGYQQVIRARIIRDAAHGYANTRIAARQRVHVDTVRIVQRKVVTPNEFTSLDQVEDRLTAFEQRYNATARPFRWKFTPADLEDLIARIERHEQKEQNPQQPSGCDNQPAPHALAA
jgi:hypothetical protein